LTPQERPTNQSSERTKTDVHNHACAHCGKLYRTLLKRQYGIQSAAGIKQSIPLATQWRCLACGKSYTLEGE
jgi:DNA-directed RNA polymerase subunit RPC12/RpoP